MSENKMKYLKKPDVNIIIPYFLLVLMFSIVLSFNAFAMGISISFADVNATVGDEVKFTCVDGPEFDGFKVNFDEAMRRQTMYKTEEGKKLLRIQDKGTHSKNPYCDCKEEE